MEFDAHIKAIDSAEDYSFKTDDMLSLGHFFLAANKEKKIDYVKKYKTFVAHVSFRPYS